MLLRHLFVLSSFLVSLFNQGDALLLRTLLTSHSDMDVMNGDDLPSEDIKSYGLCLLNICKPLLMYLFKKN